MSVRTATAAAAAAALFGSGALLLPADRPEATGQVSAHRADPVVVAHRGASGHAPENTLAAVDAAEALGVDWVENDVQRTRDGVLVVLHDTDLKRTTDVEQVFPDRAPWAVKDFTAAELAKLDAGSWFGAQFAGTRVPTLTQFLHRLERNRQKLLLEIKTRRPIRASSATSSGRWAVRGGWTAPTYGTGWSSRASARTASSGSTACART